MRKATVIALAVFLVFAGAVSMASAAQMVANTSQKGSLLIFPKVVVQTNATTGVLTQDTIIEINNDSNNAVLVKCFWVNELQEVQDFVFTLTGNQPMWFLASIGLNTPDPYAPVFTVPPFNGTKGELKCWAVAQGTDPTTQEVFQDAPISFNHLYGDATIIDYALGDAWEYSSWNFAALGVAERAQVGVPGQLLLTGKAGGYDACPQFLVGDFTAFGATMDSLISDGTDLTVVPCKQDLRQDRLPTFTKLKFDVWNENEVKYSGAYQCIKCWFESFLHLIGTPAATVNNLPGYGRDKFTYFPYLKTDKGRMRIQGVASTVCPKTGVNSPLLGVASKYWHNAQFRFIAGTNLNTAGLDGTGFIYYDPQLVSPELRK